jgi:hypothetical protein
VQANDVGIERLGRRDQAASPNPFCTAWTVGATGSLTRRSRALRGAAARHLRRAFDNAAYLQVDAGRELLRSEARIESAFDDRLEECLDGPPESPRALPRARALDPGDRSRILRAPSASPRRNASRPRS